MISTVLVILGFVALAVTILAITPRLEEWSTGATRPDHADRERSGVR